jgi:hypothetical protein
MCVARFLTAARKENKPLRKKSGTHNHPELFYTVYSFSTIGVELILMQRRMVEYGNKKAPQVGEALNVYTTE